MKNPALLLTCLASTVSAQSLTVLNWSDYIDSTFLESFSAQYNVTLDYQTFDDISDFNLKYYLGTTNFDVVFPPIDDLSTMIERGLVKPLDLSKLPNYDNLDPDQLRRLEGYDPENNYAIPYLWGTTGLGINVTKVAATLGTDDFPRSWSLVFDPTYAEKLSACGITWLDSGVEMIPLSLNYIGEDSQATSRSSFRLAEEHLSTVSPFVSAFTSEDYVSAFRDSQVCLSVGYSGDIYQAIFEAEEAGNTDQLEYIIPSEGALVWFDIAVIGSNANNEAAYQFLNELLNPSVIAGISNYVWYANAVPAATTELDPDIRNDDAIYPSPEIEDRLFGYPLYSDAELRTMQRRWAIVKCNSGTGCVAPIDAVPGN